MISFFENKFGGVNMSHSVKISLISILFLSAFISFQGNASEQTIATITNDMDSNSYMLVVDSSADDREIKSFYKDIYKNGKKIGRESFNYRTLTSGMILEKKDKYTVLKLLSTNFDYQQGGLIVIDTLLNGADGSRKKYEIELSKDNNGWLLTNKGKSIKQIFIQTNKVLVLGVVGIKNIVMK